MLAIDSAGAVNHQKEFAAATITPSGEQAIQDGSLAMAYTIIDLAERPVVRRVRWRGRGRNSRTESGDVMLRTP